MEYLRGKSVYEGIVIGEVHIDKYNDKNIADEDIEAKDVDKEKEKFEIAIEKSIESLESLKSSLSEKLDKKELHIIDAHLMILKDPLFIKDIKKYIEKELKRADVAVKNVTEKYVKLFQNIESPIYKQRSLDVKDVCNRVIDTLSSEEENLKVLDGKILVTKELYPTDLLKIYKEKIALKGIVMEYGGETSHVAILAKAFNIPTLMSVDNIFQHNWTNKIILDTTENNSCVILQPTEEEVEKYSRKKVEVEERLFKINEARNLPSITKDGKKIDLYLNIGDNGINAQNINKDTISGVGLLRTELIYMNSDSFPDEEKQLQIYRELLKEFDNSHSIIIRTLDIGADKQLSYFKLKNESNPFLGLRGIRFSLENKEIFKIQLRAILRISSEKNVKIMYPMVTNLDEIEKANEILEEVKEELRERKEKFNDKIEVGIMVEVPSVILMAEEFAEKIDFFSIGSNDLTQYVLATDRLSETVGELYDCYNPAVLRAIYQIKKAGDKFGKKVSVCGEMAGEPKALLALLALGIKDLSMVEASIPTAKSLIRNIEYYKLEKLKEKILSCKNSLEVKKIIEEYINY